MAEIKTFDQLVQFMNDHSAGKLYGGDDNGVVEWEVCDNESNHGDQDDVECLHEDMIQLVNETIGGVHQLPTDFKLSGELTLHTCGDGMGTDIAFTHGNYIVTAARGNMYKGGEPYRYNKVIEHLENGENVIRDDLMPAVVNGEVRIVPKRD